MKPSGYNLDEPVAAIATALVPSALGIVRTSGKGCIELVARCFSRPEALLSANGNTLVYGWMLAPESDGDSASGSAELRRVDEVMLAVYRAPKSFTGEDSVEIIGHGGPAVILSVFRLLVASGFRPAERGEFTLRAFANGKTDLARSEAIREIIEARTDTAREHAADRLSGSLSNEIAAVKDMIVRELAAIGVEIEYPEDEETSGGAFDPARISAVCDRLRTIASSWATEKLYQDGARVVLAGRTNAGKSSLFNTLLKEERAIVSEIHGTTRDWLESSADFGGIPVRIFDTAGLRETGDAIEAEGVERSRSLAENADLVLYLVDSTEGVLPEDTLFLSASEMKIPPTILVWNKADKPGAKPLPDMDQSFAQISTTCTVSAKSGTGIADLIGKASRILMGDRSTCTDTPPASSDQHVRGPSPGTERQKDAVQTALSFLEHAIDAARQGFPMDAIEEDLEEALSSLGEITGEVTSADILDTVFSGFCVGK